MKLTKRKALTICMELWKYLEGCAGELNEKYCWVKWDEYGVMSASCPCCQYRTEHKENCNKCLLIGLWKKTCGYSPSPYINWKKASTVKLRKKYARIIWKFCEKELQKRNK